MDDTNHGTEPPQWRVNAAAADFERIVIECGDTTVRVYPNGAVYVYVGVPHNMDRPTLRVDAIRGEILTKRPGALWADPGSDIVLQARWPQ